MLVNFKVINVKCFFNPHIQGRFCRSLSWVKNSHMRDKIDLLLAVLGDGSLNCFSIPLNIFQIAYSNIPITFSEITIKLYVLFYTLFMRN